MTRLEAMNHLLDLYGVAATKAIGDSSYESLMQDLHGSMITLAAWDDGDRILVELRDLWLMLARNVSSERLEFLYRSWAAAVDPENVSHTDERMGA